MHRSCELALDRARNSHDATDHDNSSSSSSNDDNKGVEEEEESDDVVACKQLVSRVIRAGARRAAAKAEWQQLLGDAFTVQQYLQPLVTPGHLLHEFIKACLTAHSDTALAAVVPFFSRLRADTRAPHGQEPPHSREALQSGAGAAKNDGATRRGGLKGALDTAALTSAAVSLSRGVTAMRDISSGRFAGALGAMRSRLVRGVRATAAAAAAAGESKSENEEQRRRRGGEGVAEESRDGGGGGSDSDGDSGGGFDATQVLDALVDEMPARDIEHATLEAVRELVNSATDVADSSSSSGGGGGGGGSPLAKAARVLNLLPEESSGADAERRFLDACRHLALLNIKVVAAAAAAARG